MAIDKWLHMPPFAPLIELEQTIATLLENTRHLNAELEATDTNKYSNSSNPYSTQMCQLDQPIMETLVPVLDKHSNSPVDRQAMLETAFKLKFVLIQEELGTRLHELKDSVFQCLDLSLRCVELGLIDQIMPLTYLEEVLEFQTVETSEVIYGYLKQRKERLTGGTNPTQALSLVLLRLSNDLLRRLSKAKNTVFSGRILMLLASVFPIAERSGVNLTGHFNVDNVTLIEGHLATNPPGPVSTSSQRGESLFNNGQSMDVDEESSTVKQALEPETFYTEFWKLQAFFSNPTTVITQPQNMERLQSSMEHALEKISEIAETELKARGQRADAPESPDDTQPADSHSTEKHASHSSTLSPKRKHVESNGDVAGSTTYYPKFLTSPKLLQLEMSDPYFRKHILVQFLIILQYLEHHTTATQAAYSKITNPNRSFQPHWVLEQKDLEWTASIKPGIMKQLKLAGSESGDRNFLTTVQAVLDHDVSWLTWKTEGCNKFERPPLTNDDIQRTNDKRRKLSERLKPFKQKLGCATLSQLWQDVEDQDSGLGSNWTPQTVDEYLSAAPMIAKRDLATRRMQGKPMPSELERKDLEQTRLWKALRLGSENYMHLYGGVTSISYTLQQLTADIKADVEWEEEIKQNNGQVPKKPEPVKASPTVPVPSEANDSQSPAATKTSEEKAESVSTVNDGEEDGGANVIAATAEDTEMAELDPEAEKSTVADIKENEDAELEEEEEQQQQLEDSVDKMEDITTSEKTPVVEMAPIVISLTSKPANKETV
ncbi:hypothetical protein EDD11_001372 [Mortierella claussenii]|nr:hypothetical protein EDD11_001372 [Mortierella claussenii]